MTQKLPTQPDGIVHSGRGLWMKTRMSAAQREAHRKQGSPQPILDY
ncbi:hypothetical protein DFP92_110104 [Yoonia sediminilitoris]|uniref:Uncharacterized protein n=1 Tax=Yoonia sediminilitoris TaxID=1286148 RepID=A0A2T6KC50_9RHOB|nr:hypothetical protein C8N45_110104 [Yoonia sediminilitoris]RCW93159.1 hypothetical protein DFP92_110104 [Yoonia sediminilitoris]